MSITFQYIWWGGSRSGDPTDSDTSVLRSYSVYLFQRKDRWKEERIKSSNQILIVIFGTNIYMYFSLRLL